MAALTFLQALEMAESQARSALDPALAGRLSAGIALVRDGRVFQTSAGLWEVDSASREGLVYSVNGTCNCDDAHFNKPPQGLCKHRLSVYLARRINQLMTQPPAPVVPEVVEPLDQSLPMARPGVQGRPWLDTDVEPGDGRAPGHVAQSTPVETEAVPAPLPEAPASVNVRVRISGRECQLTLRDTDETRLLARLEAVLTRFPLEAKPASPGT